MGNARDINLDVVANDKTDRGTRSASRNFDRLRSSVDRVKRSTNPLAKDVDRVGVSVMGLSVKLGATASKMLRAGGPVAAVAALAGGLLALKAASLGAAVGVVGVLGGGLVALGVKAAMGNKRVRDEFSKTKAHIREQAKDFGKPFEPVLISIARNVRKTFDYFKPALESAMVRLAPALQRFQTSFFNALKGLRPVIDDVATQFALMLDRIGPKLPGLISAVGNAIRDMVGIVQRNPGAVEGFVDGLTGIAKAAPKVLNFFIRVGTYVDMFITGLNRAMIESQIFSTQLVIGFLKVVRGAANAAAKIPGPWQDSMKQAAASVDAEVRKMEGDLNGLKTDRSRTEVQALQNRINLLRSKQVDAKTNPAAYERSMREMAELQRKIYALQGKTLTVTTQFRIKGSPSSGFGGGGLASAQSDTIVGRKPPAFATAGGLSGGPVGGANRVEVGPTNVTTTVLLDGDPFRALVRNAVTDDRARAAHRAKYGRR